MMSKGKKIMEIIRIILIILMWFLIIGFSCNFIMQKISYSFYKNAKKVTEISYEPQFIQFNDTLTGYGYNLDKSSDKVILFFGGSNYIAYNSVATYSGKFDCPFVSADYYGTQGSKGRMNLKTMQQTSMELYDWVKKEYPQSQIVIMGHSYGTGIATYLASVCETQCLIIAAGYRDVSDLYNKMTPIFWGPLKVFISNNIQLSEYAREVKCSVYVIGSDTDTTLDASLQKKVAECFDDSELKIFNDIKHEEYFVNDNVIEYVTSKMEYEISSHL